MVINAQNLSNELYKVQECSGRATAFGLLRRTARQTSAALTGLATVSVSASARMEKDKALQSALLNVAKTTSDHVCSLVTQVQKSHLAPADDSANQALFTAAREIDSQIVTTSGHGQSGYSPSSLHPTAVLG